MKKSVWTKKLLNAALAAAIVFYLAPRIGLLPDLTAGAAGAISSAQELYDVRYDLSGTYVLAEDIDLSGYAGGEWSPIGDFAAPFTGTFDGQGHVIKNLKITAAAGNDSYIGLFGAVQGGNIENLGLVDTQITLSGGARAHVGGIVGRASGPFAIENCYSTGGVSVSIADDISYVGGIVGYAHADSGELTIKNCYNTGAIASAAGTQYPYAGGIAGRAFTTSGGTLTIENCHNTGDISASTPGTYAYAGGIAGMADGEAAIAIRDCYNTGAVAASAGPDPSDEAHFGDIAGHASDNVTISGAGAPGPAGPGRTLEAAPTADAAVSISAIGGIAAPAAGERPVSEVAATEQYTGAVTWSPAVADGDFDYGTIYTATIALTSAPGYTFAGVAADFFTVAGAAQATNGADSGTVAAVFPATRQRAQRDIADGTDTFRFSNITSDFFSGSAGTYRVTGDYYAHLLDTPGLSGSIRSGGMPTTWKQYLIDAMNTRWTGSCFGMSAVLSLARAGALEPSFFQPGARNLNQLAAPKNSATVTNLVNYYHLLQSTPITNRTMQYSATESDNIKYVADSMLGSEHPVIISFLIYNNAEHTSLLGGHSVVGYEIVNTGSDYEIKIWDPNSLGAPSDTLTISHDYLSAAFSSGKYPDIFIRSAHTVESGEYDYRNIQQLLSGNAASEAPSPHSAGPLPAAAITVNYADFTITSSSGQTATVVGGIKSSGDLDIGNAEPLSEPGPDLLLRFAVPGLAPGAAYTVTPASSADECRTSFFLDAEGGGYYASINAAGAGDFVFDVYGSVSAKFSGAVQVSAALTLNSMDADMYTVSAAAYGSEIAIARAADGQLAISSGAGSVDITASGDYSSVAFENVDASGGVLITGTGDEVSLLAANGAEIASKRAGRSIVFYSLGGTPIDAIANIADGSTVDAPPDPERPGFVFAGWYKDSAYAVIHSFSGPVTENLALYAKWDTAAPLYESPYIDVPDDAWYTEAVRYVTERSLMDGIGGGKFAPDANMTRAMLVTVLHRYATVGDGVLDAPPAGEPLFDDVDYESWYGDAVRWAAENGITRGIGGGKFGPGGNVTYEQIDTMFHRFYQLAADVGPLTADGGPYLVDSFSPSDTVTRAEAAALLMEFIASVEAVG
jgi:uncharacterized repeat protein (TIGR02543 family)